MSIEDEFKILDKRYKDMTLEDVLSLGETTRDKKEDYVLKTFYTLPDIIEAIKDNYKIVGSVSKMMRLVIKKGVCNSYDFFKKFKDLEDVRAILLIDHHEAGYLPFISIRGRHFEYKYVLKCIWWTVPIIDELGSMFCSKSFAFNFVVLSAIYGSETFSKYNWLERKYKEIVYASDVAIEMECRRIEYEISVNEDIRKTLYNHYDKVPERYKKVLDEVS